MDTRIYFKKFTSFVSLILLILFSGSLFGQFYRPLKAVKGRQILIKGEKLDTLYATSSGIMKGRTYVVVYWKPVTGVTGYNLYRRELTDFAYPEIPLNGKKPISSVSTCDELKAVIPEGSTEWEMLKNAFSSISSTESTGSSTGENKSGSGKSSGSSKSSGTMLISPDKFSLVPSSKIGLMQISPLLLELNLCSVFNRELTEEEQALFDLLATTNLKIRLARGWAYIDQTVTPEKRYVYELRGVSRIGEEKGVARSDVVWAGHYTLPDPPASVSAAAGDNKVLITWDRNEYAFSYMVQRSTNPAGVYKTANNEPIIYDIMQDLNGDTLVPPKPGFVDFQWWDDEGEPIYHHVGSDSLDGPTNYVTYYYKVASRDILDRTGTWSTYVFAMPTDHTSPMAPGELKVDPYFSSIDTGLALSWRKVTRDIQSHKEQDVTQTYWIFRADSLSPLENLDTLTTGSTLYVHSMTANPQDITTPTLSWTDTDPDLVPDYGEKDFYYRLKCIDAHNNESSPSAAISGRVPDRKPPGPTNVVDSEGYAEYIRIMWEPNTEPDLGGYQIYRSLCDFGQPYQPQPRGQKDDNVYGRYPCDFFLVGEVLKSDADSIFAVEGRIYFDDYSVPEGSPVCYAYWVRAFDMARNLYPGQWSNNCPDAGEYICQRLYEEDAPPVPVISGLKARNNTVLVEWISSPIQDLRAFHIYRSEKENDPPVFVGCVLKDGTLYSGKWGGMKPSCGDIPAEADPQSVAGSFKDSNVIPNQVYWYRVSALDWLGNESEAADLTKIPGISTFTFSKDLPAIPVVLAPGTSSSSIGCGLVVKWTPSYDPSKLGGFIVFRSTSETGTYRQVSSIVQDSKYEDKNAHRGTDYWYCVQSIDKKGKLSEHSVPVKYSY